MTGAVLAGAGHAVPAGMDQAGLWEEFFAGHYGHDRVARQVFASAGITTRHGVADPRTEDVSQWSTGQRMLRYAAEAPALGKEAVEGALAAAGLAAADIGLLAVASCTGYATPGLDLVLARDLGMPPTLQRLLIGHMGCYAALPGLATAADYVTARGRPAVLLCCELTSLHVQPAHAQGSDPVQQMVAHALFSDAAAAVVLVPGDQGARPGRDGFEVVDTYAVTDHATADHMTWDVTDHGFRMGLSPKVPAVLGRHVADAVQGLLEPHRLASHQVAAWAVHPGGRRILEVVADRLALREGQLADSYAVLDQFGNCSSATVLLVLERLEQARSVPPGGHVVAMAFGPGLTLYLTLLRRRTA